MANGFLLRSLPFTPLDPGDLAAGTSAAFVANDFMGMAMRSATAGAQLNCVIDLGAAQGIDTIAVLNANPGDGAAAAEIFADTGTGFSPPALSVQVGPPSTEVVTAANRRHLLHLFATPQVFRYWQIRLNAVPGRQLEMARILIGTRLQPGRNFSFGVARGVNDLGSTEFAARGAFLRRTAAKRRQLGLTWQYLTETECEERALPLVEAVGNTEPLLACLDPDADPQRSRRIYFGPLQGNLALNWRARDRWEKRVQLVSLI